jgi:NADH-quinone oxidoreductase subunit C
MNEQLQSAIQTLKEKFNCEEQVFRGEHTLFVHAADLLEACRILRGDFGFNLLADLTATDYWPETQPRMHVSYQFYSLEHGIHLRLRVPLDEDALEVPSIEGLYPNANWHEREIYDMFGIHISGHSDLRRILMPYEWEGHPLRKDYPLGYEEPQFTFNYEKIAAQKVQATE